MEKIETNYEKQNQNNILITQYQNKKNHSSELDLKKTPFKISIEDKQSNIFQLNRNIETQTNIQSNLFYQFNQKTQTQSYIRLQSKCMEDEQKQYLHQKRNQTELQRFLERKYFGEIDQKNQQEGLNPITDNKIQKNEKIQYILSQMNDHKQSNFFADIKFKEYPYLYFKLSEKVKKFTIVVCNYLMYSQMQLNQLIKNQKNRDEITEKWSFLECSQSLQTKTKILQKYQLLKLKLLFISPEIFQFQDYHHFKCQQLIITDYHLYSDKPHFLQKILKKTLPNQILYCSSIFNIQLSQDTKKIISQQQQINIPIIKWINNENKQKIIWNILKKCEGKKVLIIVDNRKQAQIIYNSLSFHSISPFNLCQHIPKHVIQTYKQQNILFKQFKHQNLLLKNLQKAKRYQIIISQDFDALKLLNYDVLINYRFPLMKHYLNQLELVSINFGFITDNDYFQIRHKISTQILDPSRLKKFLTYVLQKQKLQPKPQKYKRFFSETLDQIMLKKFSVDKQDYSCQELKGIKILKCSQLYNMQKEQIEEILNILQNLKYISIMKNVNYEGNIHQYDVEKFKNEFKINIEKNKINFLNLATEMKITTKQLLNKLRNKKIQYRITQQIIGIKLEKQYNNINSIIQKVYQKMFAKVQKAFNELDTAYTTFKRSCTSNYELYHKNKNEQAKNLNFYKNLRSKNKNQIDNDMIPLPLVKLSASQQKVLKKQIIQSKSDAQYKLSQHEMVMQLKGQIINKSNNFLNLETNHLCKKYYKCKYEDLLEIVKEALKDKKVKLN